MVIRVSLFHQVVHKPPDNLAQRLWFVLTHRFPSLGPETCVKGFFIARCLNVPIEMARAFRQIIGTTLSIYSPKFHRILALLKTMFRNLFLSYVVFCLMYALYINRRRCSSFHLPAFEQKYSEINLLTCD